MKEPLVALTLILVIFSCQKTQTPSDKNYTTQTKQEVKTTSHELDASEKSEERKTITYTIENAKEWLLEHVPDELQQAIVFALNRTDKSNFARMDSVVIPTNLSYDIASYLPFPSKVDYLKDITKIVFFSYPTQTFAAYEKGGLIYTGPTNMGGEKHLTPTGLFYTNWKAKVSTSTVNDTWILKWNFNISNKGGVGWHQYSLPGYPVSHSCLRLQQEDAKHLYYWADQWIMENKDSIRAKGTPVIIFGKYDFDSPKPWLQLISNPRSIDITADELQRITQGFLNEILEEQKNRETFKELQ